MKTLSSILFCFFALLNASHVSAQGTIHCFVVDSLSMDQLKAAEITLMGTTFNALSNTDGEFRIAGIPPGEYMLQASYLGYKGKQILIKVESDETLNLRVELVPGITVRDGSVFTRQAMGQAEEINQQNRSSTVKNVIAGEKLRELPDENIAMALSRLPGVSIMHSPFLPINNPGRGVAWGTNSSGMSIYSPPHDDFSLPGDHMTRIFIRGLDSKYSTSTVDGMRILPTSAKDKSIDLDILSAREFQNIEVHKTITSDEDADATAGAINFVTAKASSHREIQAQVFGNYNRLDESGKQFAFAGMYGERFFDNVLGIQANAAVDKGIVSDEYQEGVGYLPWFRTFSYTNAGRERTGANIELDYNTPDGGSIWFKNMFNKTHTDYNESLIDSILFLPIYTFNNREAERHIVLSSLGGRNVVLGADVDWYAAFSESHADHPFDYSLNFYQPQSFPLPPDPMPPASYYLEYTLNSPSTNRVKEQTVSLDIARKYVLSNEMTGELKIGGKYRVNGRSYNEDLRVETGSVMDTSSYRKLADGTVVLKDFSGTRFDGLVGKDKTQILLAYFQNNPPGERAMPEGYGIPLLSNDALRLWRQLNFNDYYSHDGADINSYDLSEGVVAGYALHTLDFGQWATFIAGLRIESERNSFTGYSFPDTIEVLANLYNTLPNRTTMSHYNKTTTLPNFQMMLRPSDFLNLRLAAYKTLIRPDCIARMPKYFSVEASNFYYLNIGNPDLKNSDVWNYEFQTQFYGNGIGQLSLNAFYKNIGGMVQATNGLQMAGADAVESLGINWRNYTTNFPFNGNSVFSLYSYYNSPKPTRLWGFELEHEASFRYLPGFLKNIVLNYNVTFLRSETWVKDVMYTATTTTEILLFDEKQRLSDVPDWFANVNLGYDIQGFSFRVSYFSQGEHVMSYLYLGGVFPQEIKENKVSRLDIALRQQILENISIILNLNNITNSKEEALGGYPTLPSYTAWTTAQSYRYGMNVDFGVGINL